MDRFGVLWIWMDFIEKKRIGRVINCNIEVCFIFGGGFVQWWVVGLQISRVSD